MGIVIFDLLWSILKCELMLCVVSGGNAVMVMVGDGCEGVPAVVENCEFTVLVIVDDSAVVELSVVDSGEVALGGQG